MERSYVGSDLSSLKARGFTAVLVLIVAMSALVVSLSRFDSASAHCDSVDGPVVMAAKASLEANDVTLVLPYVQPDAEAELTAAFDQAMEVRAHGGEAQAMADRYFFETAVRLHRAGEGAPYTGLKDAAEPDPALEAAETALESGSLEGLYTILDGSIKAGVQEHYQAVIDAREREASEGTVEASRVRVEAELEFELYIHGLGQAAIGGDAHAEGAPAEAGGHEG